MTKWLATYYIFELDAHFHIEFNMEVGCREGIAEDFAERLVELHELDEVSVKCLKGKPDSDGRYF